MSKKSMIAAFLLALPLWALSPLAYRAAATRAEADQVADANGAAADQALKASMAKMHKGMMIKESGNADVDFVKSMIPHHQGAVDMAKVELQYGKDPEMKELARKIVSAQEAEIATMRDWLKKQGQ